MKKAIAGLLLFTVILALLISSCQKEKPCPRQVVTKIFTAVPPATVYPDTLIEQHLNCTLDKSKWDDWARDSTYVKSWSKMIDGVNTTITLTAKALVKDNESFY